MDATWTFINTSLSSGTGRLFLLIQEHQVFRIGDKLLLSSFFIQLILLTTAFIKLSGSGKADVEYSTCICAGGKGKQQQRKFIGNTCP
jgi:hypothetical protein